MTSRELRLTLLLASFFAIFNAVKPAVVDDTAYLLHARHIAEHPLDPYGFKIFWYTVPNEAMDVLLPPVLPYWLAAGIGIFGEQLVLLKLWMFPFFWLFARSVGWLMKRFVPFDGYLGTVGLALSPAVLPMVNVMLDLPALALGLAGLTRMIKATDEAESWRVPNAILAGVLLGLAMQTKYTMLVLPGVYLAYAITRSNGPSIARGLCLSLLSIAVGVGVFAGWEKFLLHRYGVSHFLHQAKEQAEGTIGEKLKAKWELAKLQAPALLCQAGPMLVGFACWVLAAWNWTRGLRIASLVARIALLGFIALGLAMTMVLKESKAVLIVEADGTTKLDWPTLTFVASGLISLLILVTSSIFGLLVLPNRNQLLFLLGWFAIEVAGTLVLSPFPAARRVMGLSMAFAVLSMFLVARLSRHGDKPRPPKWIAAAPIALGLLIAGIDLWDAHPEKILANQARAAIPDVEGETIWFNGHWGFQYYCDRAGMKPVIPEDTVLLKGDWLVFPVIPDDYGFYRPYHGGAKFRIDPDSTKQVAEFVWEDRLSAQTVPNLYGGAPPLRGRNHPRLKVVVYRITADWLPERVP